MASSSSRKKYDVFPSFSGKDVRISFLSHLLEALNRKSIITFIDNGIERSCLIAAELLLAIRQSRISIVVFSNKYATSTWCLNELAEIHECFKNLSQIVIPIFYNVDTSDVRNQTGEFGKAFEKTCKGETENGKLRWKKALAELASVAGYDSRTWNDEAKAIEQISKDVLNKLFTPSDDFGQLVGIEAHVEAMNSVLCLESEAVRMVGIVGTSGIGKSTIARALFSKIRSQFQHHAFVSYKRTIQDDYSMKLFWAKQFLSGILCQNDIKIDSLGVVEQRLKHKKVLIILDDVYEVELLETLVGQTGWFGYGSRIIVVTQDRALLKSHQIDLVYEVEFPSREVALQMFCWSAFRRYSPSDGFLELAVEITKLAGNLPLGLSVLGASLRGKDKEYWVDMMPRLRDCLDGKIEKTLRVSYDVLDGKDQLLFLYIACLLNRHTISYIISVVGDIANIGLRMLADKSLIRLSRHKTVEMHNLLRMLGRDIVRAESIQNPGKRRFLVDAEDICDVFNDNTGTETVLGICLNTSEINGPLFIDDKAFQGMHNLRFLKIYKERLRNSGEGILYLPQGLVYLPRKLRILHWDESPLKCMPSNFKAEHLVKLYMKNSTLEKLWEGTQPLPSLRKINLSRSKKLKEIPDLSGAKNLQTMNLFNCSSLVTLPSSIRGLNKLRMLNMRRCSKLETLPTDVNLESLIFLDLRGCSELRSFPRISKNILKLGLHGPATEEDSLWIENISRSTGICWEFCPLRCLPSNFRPEGLVSLSMAYGKFEKLWEGVQSLGSLLNLDLAGCENLKEFPNLSKAINLEILYLDYCKSLIMVPSSIQSLNNLEELHMRGCTGLKSLPTNLNLESLSFLNLNGCSQLRSFPQISTSIDKLFLNDTAIEEIPSWIKDFSNLTKLRIGGCKSLKRISSNICKLEFLQFVDFSSCEGVTEFDDAGVMTRISHTINDRLALSEESSFLLKILFLCTILVQIFTLCAKIFQSLKGISHSLYHPRDCFSLDRNAHKLIVQSNFKYMVLPGGQVPKCFTNRACGNSITIPLPKSSFFEEPLGYKVCVALEPPAITETDLPCIGARWYIRGKTGVPYFHFQRLLITMDHLKMDHLLVLHFRFPTEKVTEFPSDLDNVNVKFEFYHRVYGCSCLTEICPHSVQRIKGCGVQLCHVHPRWSDSGESLERTVNLSTSDTEEGLKYDLNDDSSWTSSDEGEDLDYNILYGLSSLDKGEYLENFPTHSTSTPEAIAQWLFEFDNEPEVLLDEQRKIGKWKGVRSRP